MIQRESRLIQTDGRSEQQINYSNVERRDRVRESDGEDERELNGKELDQRAANACVTVHGCRSFPMGDV